MTRSPNSRLPVSDIQQLRVGRISYTNVAPVETAFDLGVLMRPAAVTAGSPAALNAMLSAGDLDAGPVSAAHYLANTDQLALLGDCGIVAREAAISVVLVSRRPPALLEDASIAVTRESASGRALLEAVLRGRDGVRARYEAVDDPRSAALAGRPTLLIGDEAIAARDQAAPSDVHDLGTAWTDWTGLPMVFAVWAVRRDVLAQRPGDVAALAQAYSHSRSWGDANRAEVIDAAMHLRPRDRQFYERYFSTLTYTIDQSARAGLARFRVEIAAPEVSRVAR
jgi:chorismate dehydratase